MWRKERFLCFHKILLCKKETTVSAGENVHRSRRTRILDSSDRFIIMHKLLFLGSVYAAVAQLPDYAPRINLSICVKTLLFPRGSWLSKDLGFYAIPESFALSRSETFHSHSGRMYGRMYLRVLP